MNRVFDYSTAIPAGIQPSSIYAHQLRSRSREFVHLSIEDSRIARRYRQLMSQSGDLCPVLGEAAAHRTCGWRGSSRHRFVGDLIHPPKVFFTAQIPQSGRAPLPDGGTRMWSPITSTLMMGRSDVVLVDPAADHRAGRGGWRLGGGLGRNLAQIYITHGHGDHWFGAIPLVQRFAGVTVRATEGTAKVMAAQNAPKLPAGFWDQVSDTPRRGPQFRRHQRSPPTRS